MKFEDLQNVNATIKTTNIKGKEYAEVKERIKAFRQLFPEGFIHTRIADLQEGFVVISAEVGYYDKDAQGYAVERILGQGTAYEKEGTTNINKTSFIENCETSAVGRALGMLGIGIDTAIASADEMSSAVSAREQAEVAAEIKKAEAATIDEAKVAVLTQKLVEANIPMEKVFKLYKVNSLAGMTAKQWDNAMKNIENIKKAEV